MHLSEGIEQLEPSNGQSPGLIGGRGGGCAFAASKGWQGPLQLVKQVHRPRLTKQLVQLATSFSGSLYQPSTSRIAMLSETWTCEL